MGTPSTPTSPPPTTAPSTPAPAPAPAAPAKPKPAPAAAPRTAPPAGATAIKPATRTGTPAVRRPTKPPARGPPQAPRRKQAQARSSVLGPFRRPASSCSGSVRVSRWRTRRSSTRSTRPSSSPTPTSSTANDKALVVDTHRGRLFGGPDRRHQGPGEEHRLQLLRRYHDAHLRLHRQPPVRPEVAPSPATPTTCSAPSSGQLSWLSVNSWVVLTFTVVEAHLGGGPYSGSHLPHPGRPGRCDDNAIQHGLGGSAAVAIGQAVHPAVARASDGLSVLLPHRARRRPVRERPHGRLLADRRVQTWSGGCCARRRTRSTSRWACMGITALLGGFFMPFYPWWMRPGDRRRRHADRLEVPASVAGGSRPAW